MKRIKTVLALTLAFLLIFQGTIALAGQISLVSEAQREAFVLSLTEEEEVPAGARSIVVGNDVFLGGRYIEIGVSGSGSFGSENQAPEGFHPAPSGYGALGFRADNDGFGTGLPPTTGDFFLPGNPEEGFTVGYRQDSISGYVHRFTNVERNGVIDIPSATTNLSSGDTLAAKTVGVTSDGKLKVQQMVSFRVNDKYFKNTVTLTNQGTETLFDTRYMRSFDPDQDQDLHGEWDTINAVLENPPQDMRALVRATGPISGQPIFFAAFDERARASSFGFTNRDPYSASAWLEDGSQLLCEYQDDSAIVITFTLGDLGPGQSVTCNYYTSLNENFDSGLDEILHEITLSGSTVYEKSPVGTVIGTLGTSSSCAEGSHTFVLINDAGGRFAVDADQLKVANGNLLDYAAADSHVITVRLICTENKKTYDKDLVISVMPLPPQPLIPILEGVTYNVEEATYTAHWGWKNENSYTTTVPLSEDNKFTGSRISGALDPMTEFVSGRVYNAFTTEFDGLDLVWTLTGPDEITRTATARGTSPAFDAAIFQPLWPVLEGISYNVEEATYTAHWGYFNENLFPITVPYVHMNP